MFRLLLTCLLAITLPLKALAAVTMVGCGPGHHGARGSVEVPAAAAAHDHGSRASSSHQHGSVGEQALEAGDKPDGAADAGIDDGAKMTNAKCGNCAPCNAAAAPAPDAQRFTDVEPASGGVPSVSSAFCGVVGDVPHKPPRLFLA